MTLPESNRLPINLLAACFNKTSATYKFYWFISIIQSVEEGKTTIDKQELFSKMISNAWYTVNYFHVSFGKQDLIQKAINTVKEVEGITIDEAHSKINNSLCSTSNHEVIETLWHFDRHVPHWFLSPWFPKKNNETDTERERRIYSESKKFKDSCLYSLHQNKIDINPRWINYLTDNSRLLKDYCYWNLAIYLQSKNPNIPDIPNKLIKPAKRNSLTKQRTQFWDLVVENLGSVKCIYTGQELTIGNYAIEHFIPYSFVSHDLIWNLIPANKSFNSSKSDKIPNLEKYFDPFFELQKTAIDIVKVKSPKCKLLDDYFTILFDFNSGFSKEKFKETIQPLISIALNNGFEELK